jgi:hypothetical protein
MLCNTMENYRRFKMECRGNGIPTFHFSNIPFFTNRNYIQSLLIPAVLGKVYIHIPFSLRNWKYQPG